MPEALDNDVEEAVVLPGLVGQPCQPQPSQLGVRGRRRQLAVGGPPLLRLLVLLLEARLQQGLWAAKGELFVCQWGTVRCAKGWRGLGTRYQSGARGPNSKVQSQAAARSPQP